MSKRGTSEGDAYTTYGIVWRLVGEIICDAIECRGAWVMQRGPGYGCWVQGHAYSHSLGKR
jgi:hypothetical protein